MKYILLFILIFSGCGYKPTSTYTKNYFLDKIYTDVKVEAKDPEYAIIVKDILNEAVVSKFNSQIVDKTEANSFITIKFNSISFSPLEYDENGYVVFYRANVSLKIDYKTKDISKSMSVNGSYEFPVEANSVISDAKKMEAIRYGSIKAFDNFISKISLESIRDDNSANY